MWFSSCRSFCSDRYLSEQSGSGLLFDNDKYVKFQNLFAEISCMQETNSIEAEEVREYRAGEVVVKEGDSGEFFYAIISKSP